MRQPYPKGAGLAGSSLCMDDAIRNLVNWEIASFDEAIAMASSRVTAILAPAISARGITLPVSEVEWSDGLTVSRVLIAGEQYHVA